jgi:flagellar biogenesis protein FliO
MPDTLTVIFALVGVIAVIALMFWAARRFQKKYGYGFGNSGKNIRIEDSVAVSPDSRLLIADVNGKRYLIGTGNVRLLSELNDTPEELISEAQPSKQTDRKTMPIGKKTMPIGEAFRTVLAEKLNGTKNGEERKNVGEDS